MTGMSMSGASSGGRRKPPWSGAASGNPEARVPTHSSDVVAFRFAAAPSRNAVTPGEPVHLRPGRALVQGLAHMFDFMPVDAQMPQTRSVEEDMALAWRDVLSVVKPPPAAGPFH